MIECSIYRVDLMNSQDEVLGTADADTSEDAAKVAIALIQVAGALYTGDHIEVSEN